MSMNLLTYFKKGQQANCSICRLPIGDEEVILTLRTQARIATSGSSETDSFEEGDLLIEIDWTDQKVAHWSHFNRLVGGPQNVPEHL